MDELDWGVWRNTAPPPTLLSRVREYGYHIHEEFSFYRPGATRDDCLLYVTLGGHPNIWHGARQMAGTRGSVTLYLTGEDHRYAAARWEAHWFHFYPSPLLLDALRQSGITMGLTFSQPLSEQALQSFAGVFTYPTLPEALALHRCAVLVEHTIYTCLQQLTMSVPLPHTRRLQSIAAYIVRNPALPHRLNTLAAMTNLSLPHFAALFRQEYSQSVHAFVIAQRMQHAQYLLMRTRMSAGEIGLALGYRTPHQFYAAFKKVTGMSPGAYRAQNAV